MGGIVAITVTQVATLGVLVWGIGRALRVSRKTLCAIALAVMFYNSGNYGLPLAELAYPKQTARDGGAVQAFVVLTQNVLTFTVGLSIAAWAGSARVSEIFTKVFRLPVLYTLTGALATRAWLDADPTHRIPTLVAKPAEYLSNGLVPVALVTLGVQLAGNPRWPRWKPVSMAIVLRLLLGPVQMAALLWTFHRFGVAAMDLWPWPAELLILTAAVPSAVNTLLLTIELDGDADLAADCVFWTTVVSCVTITGWLVVIRAVAS
jgi:predicted permease